MEAPSVPDGVVMTITNVEAGREREQPNDATVVPGARALSPAQVTDILRRSGELPRGEVSSVTVQPLGVGESMMSDLVRLRLDYEPPAPVGAPATLVVKFPCPEPFRREVAERFDFYRRELTFYGELADLVPARSPRCYVDAFEPSTNEFTLVLEDLAHHRAVSQIDGCGWSDALRVIDALAALHAPWWDRTEALPARVVRLDGARQIDNLATTFTRAWPSCRQLVGDRLPAELLRVGDAWADIGPRLAHRLARPATLCHGDARLDNLCFDDDRGDVILFDWQLVTTSHGVSDLAYFTTQSMRIDARAGRDGELLDHYLGALAARGVTVDRDHAWELYRSTALAMLIFPVTLYGTYDELDDVGKLTPQTMLERSVAAITELTAWDVPAVHR